MDIRSSLDGLKTLLGVTTPGATSRPPRAASVPDGHTLNSDRATLSSAGSEVAGSATEDGVRTAKVAEVKAAIQSGTYEVPASAVASKMVDAMLGQGS
jgi:flagellar biosynthesis anti-sigma factor FlgM